MIIFGPLLLAAGALFIPSPPSNQKTGVEVWMVGSDIYTPEHAVTKALRDALERAISHSRYLQLSPAGKGSFIITIPNDVIINRGIVKNLIFFTAVVTVSNSSKSFDVSGSCYYNNLFQCANKIVRSLIRKTVIYQRH